MAHAAVLLPGSLPLYTAIFAALLTGERFRRARLVGLAAIVGCDLLNAGYSLLQAMGFRYHGSNKLLYLSLSAALGLPFVPFLPWLPDFMMVIARKK